MIRPLRKDDDLLKVAALIYDCEEQIISAVLGKREKALKRIKTLIEKENTSISYKNICCYFEDEIKGILVSYDFSKKDKKLEEQDFIDSFPLWLVLKIERKFRHYKKLMTSKEKGYYIECISVNEKYRSMGIGTMLINYVLDSFNKDEKLAYLDVRIDNLDALRLYKKLGFKVLDKKQLSDSYLGTYTMYKML